MIDWAKVEADGPTDKERWHLHAIDDAYAAFARGGSASPPDLESLRRAVNWIIEMRLDAEMLKMLDDGEAWLAEIDGRLLYQHADLGGHDGGIDIGPAR